MTQNKPNVAFIAKIMSGMINTFISYGANIAFDMGHAMGKRDFGHIRTAKAKISMSICAV